MQSSDKQGFAAALGGEAPPGPPPAAHAGLGGIHFGLPEEGAGSFLASHPVLYSAAVVLAFHVPTSERQVAQEPQLRWLRIVCVPRRRGAE